MAVKLLHKGCKGVLALNPVRFCRVRGYGAVDDDGGVCGSKGAAAACRQYHLPFKILVEGEELILPRLQGLVLRDFFVPLGAVLREGVRLEEQGGCDGGE